MQRDLDYFRLLTESRDLRHDDDDKKLRVALLADCATQHLALLLRVLFSRAGITVEIYEGMFGATELEVRNPASVLYASQPEIIVVLNSVQALRDKFYQRNNAQQFADQVASQLNSIWDSITANTNALILQSTFVSAAERFFGNYDRRVDSSFSSTIVSLNTFIADESRRRKNVLLLDLEAIASWVGRKHWFDERLWTLGKSLCSLEHLPLAAQNIVDIVLAARGRAVKCIVLDLDNTLWGGVVGDDGPHGIQIGSHGDGEPFFRLQSFLKELKNRGILLAVCSKNEEANALKPFRENQEMVLALDDIVMFVANWNNKPENIRKIQRELRIGFDSMLFLDDNPFERAAMRELLPEVIAPELPEDPGEWVAALCELNLFETASFSAEDTQRSALYLQETQRRKASETAPTFDEFLQSLDMTIEVARFAPQHLGRIVQLLQRSNQFNLTTRRLNEAECEAMMQNANRCIPLYAILKDRFGDHGLISIVILRLESGADAIEITDWLMSCRVLGRGVEEYLMNCVFERAGRMQIASVTATYIPTAKNNMVREFYARFGFKKTSESPDSATRWALAVTDYQYRPVFIHSAVDEKDALTILKG